MRKCKHGHTTKYGASPTYKSWHMMVQRCTNSKNRQYADYGGRGITVCERWFEFANFLADMGERPYGTSIERSDNSRGYDKDNCRWATRSEQQRNRRNNHNLSFDGKTQCLSAWAKELDLKPHSLYMRIFSYNWPMEKALSTPAKDSGKRRNLLKGS